MSEGHMVYLNVPRNMIGRLPPPRTIAMWAALVIAGTAVLAASHIGGRALSRAIARQPAGKGRERKIVRSVAGTAAHTVCMLAGITTVLLAFGVEVASIIAVLTSAALVLAFALQGTLSDVASGVVLAMFQLFDIGDFVRIGDVEGTVVDFQLVNTVVMHSPSEAVVTIPNRSIKKSVIFNYTRLPYHVFAFDVLLSNTNRSFDDIVRTIARDLADAVKYPDVLRGGSAPDVKVGIDDMGEVGTRLRVRVPIESSDIPSKRSRLRTGVRETLARSHVTLVDPH